MVPCRYWPPKSVPEVDNLTVAEFLHEYLDGRPPDSITVRDFHDAVAIVRERTVRKQFPRADISKVDQTIPTHLHMLLPADRWEQDGFIPIRLIEATHPDALPVLIIATPWPSAELIRSAEILLHIQGMVTPLDGAIIRVQYCTEDELARAIQDTRVAHPRPHLGPGATNREQTREVLRAR